MGKKDELAGVIESTWPKYKVIERIGKGAMGSVYRCELNNQNTNIQTQEAIKVVRISYDEDEDTLAEYGQTREEYYKAVRDDAIAEIELMDRLKSSHIVHINAYEMVEAPEEECDYILIRMDLLQNLKSYLKDRDKDSLEDRDRLIRKICSDICDALIVCESHNVLHRDIKPENILVSPNGEFYLGDFGVAKRIAVGTTLSSVGTEEFAAPEVGRGEYDKRADLYSLGLVLYKYANHGRSVFMPAFGKKVTPQDKSIANTKRLSDTPMDPPDNCSEEMADIILRLCDYDPEKRFTSAKEVKAALNGEEFSSVEETEEGKLGTSGFGGKSGIAGISGKSTENPLNAKKLQDEKKTQTVKNSGTGKKNQPTRTARSRKRRSKWKGIGFVMLLVLAVAAGITGYIKGKELIDRLRGPVTVDLAKYVIFTSDSNEYDKEGVIYLSWNEKELCPIIKEACDRYERVHKNDEGFESANLSNDTVIMNWINSNLKTTDGTMTLTGCSNGATVEAVFQCVDPYDGINLGQNIGVEFVCNECIYSIPDNAFKPIEEVDPFADITAVFSGVNGEGKVEFAYNHLPDNISFSDFDVDKEKNLSNGEKVTLSISPEVAERHHYTFTDYEKEFECSGLIEYIGSGEAITDEYLDILKKNAKNLLEKHFQEMVYTKKITKNWEDAEFWGYYFLQDKKDITENRIVLVYHSTLNNIEKAQTESKKLDWFLPISFAGVYTDENGEIWFETMSKEIEGTSYSGIRDVGSYYMGYASLDNKAEQKMHFLYIVNNNMTMNSSIHGKLHKQDYFDELEAAEREAEKASLETQETGSEAE